MDWLKQSIIAVTLLVPVWLAVGFLNRNYQVKSDTFIIWYFLGAAITIAFLKGPSLNAIVPSWRLVGTIFLIGLTVGAIANILLFRAVVNAPNPGLPVAISNLTSIGVFFFAALLARLAPNHFDAVKTDGWSFLGVVLTIIGASLIAVRR